MASSSWLAHDSDAWTALIHGQFSVCVETISQVLKVTDSCRPGVNHFLSLDEWAASNQYIGYDMPGMASKSFGVWSDGGHVESYVVSGYRCVRKSLDRTQTYETFVMTYYLHLLYLNVCPRSGFDPCSMGRLGKCGYH